MPEETEEERELEILVVTKSEPDAFNMVDLTFTTEDGITRGFSRAGPGAMAELFQPFEEKIRIMGFIEDGRIYIDYKLR